MFDFYYICLLNKLKENTIIYIAFITFQIIYWPTSKVFLQVSETALVPWGYKNLNHTTSKWLFLQKDN